MSATPPQTLRLSIHPSGRVSANIGQSGPDRNPGSQNNGGTSSRESFRNPRPKSFPIEETLCGIATIIYRTTWFCKRRRKQYPSFVLVWFDAANKRRREKRSTLEDIIERRETICREVSQGKQILGTFTPEDQMEWRLCDQAKAKHGVITSTASIVEAWCELQDKLRAGETLADCVRSHRTLYPFDVIRKTTVQVIEEYSAKQKVCSKWQRNRDLMLDRFAARFPDLAALRARDLDDWLDLSIGAASRTRRNHLDAIRGLCHFAKRRGYLPLAWSVLGDVSDPEPPIAHVNLYTPEELVKLLNRAEETKAGRKMIPFLAITAFAGVRHGEMNEEKARLLDWSDIDFETKGIYVQKDVAKTGEDRTVDMPDNLIAWLKPYARSSGRVCPVENTSNALCRLRLRAKITGPKKNALRKSFISYKLAIDRNIEAVADQAGNSPGVIKRNYRKSDTRLRESARRWFSIMPVRADVLPLFTWKQSIA